MDQPLIILDLGPATTRVVHDVLGAGDRLVLRSHPPIEVRSLPNRRPPAAFRAKSMRRGSLPAGGQSLGRDIPRGSREHVYVVVHDDGGEDLAELGAALSQNVEHDLTLSILQPPLVPMQPPRQADGSPGMLPVRDLAAAGQGVHTRKFETPRPTCVTPLARAQPYSRGPPEGRSSQERPSRGAAVYRRPRRDLNIFVADHGERA